MAGSVGRRLRSLMVFLLAPAPLRGLEAAEVPPVTRTMVQQELRSMQDQKALLSQERELLAAEQAVLSERLAKTQALLLLHSAEEVIVQQEPRPTSWPEMLRHVSGSTCGTTGTWDAHLDEMPPCKQSTGKALRPVSFSLRESPGGRILSALP